MSYIEKELDEVQQRSMEDNFEEIKVLKLLRGGLIDVIKLVFREYIYLLDNMDDLNIEPQGRVVGLLDRNYHLDIIYIDDTCIDGLATKNKYEQGHRQRHEVTGRVLSVEKYLHDLVRMGEEAEDILTKKDLNGVNGNIKIVNPRAILLFKDAAALEEEQRLEDFELTRRQYRNIIEMTTMDDLKAFFNNALEQLVVADGGKEQLEFEYKTSRSMRGGLDESVEDSDK